MKMQICLVFLVLAVHSSFCLNLNILAKFTPHCLKEANADISSGTLKYEPSKQACLMTCISKTIGSLNNDNSLNMDTILKVAKTQSTDPKNEKTVREAVESCSKINHANGCEAGFQRLACLSRTVKNQGGMLDESGGESELNDFWIPVGGGSWMMMDETQ